MKAIKILFVAVLSAALGFGVYKIFESSPEPPIKNGEEEVIIPDGYESKLKWAEMYIDSAYHAIPDTEFQTLKKRRGEMQNSFKEMTEDWPKTCQETVGMYLINRYQTRFIEMVHKELKKDVWPNYSDIKEMNQELLVELSGGSTPLKNFEDTCKVYDKVVSYNKKVNTQSSQRPGKKGINSQWNIKDTENLIKNPPYASEPVSHTTQYKNSRPEKVKEKLYNGHVAFLESLVTKAGVEIDKNPTKDNYDRIFDIVSKEIENNFKKKASIYGKSNDAYTKANKLIKILNDYSIKIAGEL